MAFNKQELALMNDLINVAWQAGAIKNPQMAQGVENLRVKVMEHMEPPKVPDEKKGKPNA